MTAKMRRYAIVIEAAGDKFSEYVHALPVCAATDDTSDEVADLLREAIDLDLESLLEDGEPLPDRRQSMVALEMSPTSRRPPPLPTRLGGGATLNHKDARTHYT